MVKVKIFFTAFCHSEPMLAYDPSLTVELSRVPCIREKIYFNSEPTAEDGIFIPCLEFEVIEVIHRLLCEDDIDGEVNVRPDC